jgi:hypothetical protein
MYRAAVTDAEVDNANIRNIKTDFFALDKIASIDPVFT